MHYKKIFLLHKNWNENYQIFEVIFWKLWKWCISILVSVCSCDGIFILYSSSRYSTISWLEHHSYMWKDETLTKTYNFAFCWHLGNRDFLIFFCLQFNILDFKKFLAVEKDLLSHTETEMLLAETKFCQKALNYQFLQILSLDSCLAFVRIGEEYELQGTPIIVSYGRQNDIALLELNSYSWWRPSLCFK